MSAAGDPSSPRADGAAFVLLAVLATALLAPAIFGGKVLLPVEAQRQVEPWKSESPEVAALRAPNLELSDAIWEVAPMAVASARAWREGVPLWDPHLMLGAPALASGKLFSHPLFVPLALAGDALEALDRVAWLHLAIAGWGMFLLLRELRCRTLAALAGALVFELNTPFLRWLSFPFVAGSIAWTPWLFLGLERAVARRRPGWAALAAAAFALQLLSGYILISYLCALAVAVRFAGPLWRAFRERRRADVRAIVLAGAIGLGGGAALAAFQVIPSLELFRESVRGEPIEPLAYFSPRAALTLLAPRVAGLPDEPGGMDRGDYRADEVPLYLGIVPLALLIVAGAAKAATQGAVAPVSGRIYPLLALLPALGAWGVPGAALVARLAVPMLASSAYSRLWSWIVFAAAVSVGLGLERLVAALEAGGREARRLGVTAIVAFGLIAVAALVAWRVAETDGGEWIRHPEELARAVAWSVAAILLLAAALARRFAPRALLVLFALAPALDLLSAIRGWNRFNDPRLALPETPSLSALAAAVAGAPAGEAPRVLNLHSTWTLPGRTPERFGFEAVSGYTSWMLRRVSLYGSATGERANASINHLYFQSCCRPLLDALGARFVLAGSDLHEEIDPARSLVQRLRRSSPKMRAFDAMQVYAAAGGGEEHWLLEHPPARIEVSLPQAARLRFSGAIGIRPEAVGCPTDGVSFAIVAIGPAGEREILREFLDPVRRPEDRAPRRFELDLTALAPGATALALETGAGPAGDVRCDWAGWVDARFVLPKPSPLQKIHDGPNPVFENVEALPRAWIVHEAEIRRPGDLEAVRASIVDPGFAPRRLAIVESDEAPQLAPAAGPESARVAGRSAERMAIAIAVSAPGLLVVSDAFYPGWRAEVDGVERRILAADLALRAVAVAPGDREVVFSYRPRTFVAGAWISAGAVTLGALWLLAVLARRRTDKSSGSTAVATTPSS